MALTPVPADPAETARMARAPSALAYYQSAQPQPVPAADPRAEAVRAAMAALIDTAFAP